jgi:hypothetical protein
MRAKSYLICAIALWISIGLKGENIAQQARRPDPGFLAKAIDILSGENMMVEKFTSGWDPGKPTEQGWAFSVILKSDQPVEWFAELTKTGSYYGLLGLSVLDRSRFKAELEHFRGAGEVVLYIGDSHEIFTADEFIDGFLDEHGRHLFDSLIFKQLPLLTETVRIPVSSRKEVVVYHRDEAAQK